ncbi:pyridoxamine 5'-phosphate oxidase family protein [Faecalispora anaeroviscerum]|uniref:pyridoxamine 5'-phosphate oxidase family protein n=1 Tax=Faecalispora anaeroviscerum TaxID=2991836 RepID=UPI0024B91608|nr:pyridoxamine 5'-phosphate oxidase family protein [Faecalispora anaeroviscerum]
MFQEMRRKDRILSPESTELLLQKGEYGVLSTMGEEYPYGVPVSYVYESGAVYIHCAIVGSKLENIVRNSKVSFCVVGQTQVLPGDFTTNYESVVLFGNAQEVFAEEKQRALELLVHKYSPDFLQKGLDYIKNADSRVKVVKITTNHLTGKSRK